jgi:hypothetical protein
VLLDMRSDLRSKDVLFRSPQTGTRRLSVEMGTMILQVPRGYSHALGVYGANKGANLSVQAQVFPGAQIKAALSLFLPTGTQPSSAGPLTTSLLTTQELSGYSLALTERGASRAISLLAQVVLGVHFRAFLLAFPATGI